MKPYCQMGEVAVYCGDSRDIVPQLGQFDACVTDPPYELGFMGRKWDGSGIAYDVGLWRKVFEALKPGAHLLAFGGTRTYHRMTCAIEDAGFEIRDCIQWIYGSGFPKSLDVSKAIDKTAGATREVVGTRGTAADIRGNSSNGNGISSEASKAKPRLENTITAPATAAAKQWDGWGTALKPANEPIVVARKPLSEGTVAANVLCHGTGALNIDKCRIGIDAADDIHAKNPHTQNKGRDGGWVTSGSDGAGYTVPPGRWPANVIHDGSEEVLAGFPQTTSGARRNREINKDSQNVYGKFSGGAASKEYEDDSGSAARFFYCAKASKDDRGDGNTHATVKPVTLMRYLCRLVTPPGGRILDPFAGSGTTLVAARLEGFHAAGVDLDQAHADIIRQRICSLGQEVFAL